MTTARDVARPLSYPQIARAEHEHGWVTESRHATSEGDVLYVRCDGCGVRRIDLRRAAEVVPIGVTKLLAAASATKSG